MRLFPRLKAIKASLLSLSVLTCMSWTHTVKAETQEIDILVAYTPLALAHHDAYFRGLGVNRTLQESLNLSMVSMNHVHQNSGTDVRYRIAHLMDHPVNFDETTVTDDPDNVDDAGDSAQRKTLDHLTAKDDGVMDEVLALRDQYGADMVVLLVEGDDWPTWTGGSANVLSANDPTLSESAPFYLVDWNGIDSTAWPHENGHAMGLHHDWFRSSHKYGELPTSHSLGYVSPDFTWRTLMAYDEHCVTATGVSCYRLPLFSDPNRIHYGGYPMGVPAGTNVSCKNRNLDNPPCDADAVASLHLTAPTVKAFRDEVVPRLPAPINLQPQGTVSSGTVALSWNEVSDATHYDILVGLAQNSAEADAFVYKWLQDQDVLYFSLSATSSNCRNGVCSISIDAMSGYHYFSVKAHDDAGHSRWADAQPFVVDQPITAGAHVVTQIAPNGTYYSAGDAVTLTFAALPYQIQAYKVSVWDRDDDYTIHSQKYPANSICDSDLCTVKLPSQPWAAHRYQWKVRADDTPYGDGDYSPKLRFYIR